MLTQLALTLLAQTEPSTPGWTWAVVIVLVVTGAAFAWAFTQLRASGRRVAQLTVEHESTTAAHRELLERERKQAKTLDEKRDEIRDLKRDLAAQKKKNHGSQEETKTLRKELRDATDELATARKQKRPAFAGKPEPAPEKQESKPAPAPEPKREEPVKPVESPKNEEIAARVTALETELEGKSEALKKDRGALREVRSELKNLRRRVEGLRRVDLVSTGKIEILEDKLHSMGRKYYDAVSELAALKGEVKPPEPRDLAHSETERKRDEIATMAAPDDDAFDDDDESPAEEMSASTDESADEPTAEQNGEAVEAAANTSEKSMEDGAVPPTDDAEKSAERTV